jgi:succinate dehydrogenase/fumarate reductase cytochrome b subunit
MENQVMDNVVNVANENGVITKDNAIKVFAVIGVVATAYHGFRGIQSLVGRFRKEEEVVVKTEKTETTETTEKKFDNP